MKEREENQNGNTYAIVARQTESVENATRLCSGCARVPMARIVVSLGAIHRMLEMNATRKGREKCLQAPVAPKTPINATLNYQSRMTQAGQSDQRTIIQSTTHPTAINLSEGSASITPVPTSVISSREVVLSSIRLVLPVIFMPPNSTSSSAGRASSSVAARSPNKNAGRAMRTTPTRLHTITYGHNQTN